MGWSEEQELLLEKQGRNLVLIPTDDGSLTIEQIISRCHCQRALEDCGDCLKVEAIADGKVITSIFCKDLSAAREWGKDLKHHPHDPYFRAVSTLRIESMLKVVVWYEWRGTDWWVLPSKKDCDMLRQS